ncbi:DUF6177 family protein [Compostimonas suwonensis]|uniref:DUF6177 family protein n=1 Tax=Compostimonas suwonensis TaxID=1048394 RepID=UPI0012FE2301|nr:DUF6177 family protein [Compostimonas suwonensis]
MSQSTVPHPLVDEAGEGFVVSRSDAPLVGFGAGRAGLLVEAARAGVRVILLTPASSRLTFAMLGFLELVGGVWVVEGSDGGLRLGLSGQRIAALAAALAVPVDAEVEVDALRSSPAAQNVLTVSMTVSHKPTVDTQLGRTTELIAEELASSRPSGWGVHEPAGLHWNTQNVTRFARQRMPRDSRLVVAAENPAALSGLLTVQRSAKGVTETTKALVGVGDEQQTWAAIEDRLPRLLGSLAERQFPLFGTVFLGRGESDLTTAARLPQPPFPVAMLLGPQAVRDLGIDTDAATERFGATVVGRRRIPSLIVPFTSDRTVGWHRFRDFAGAFGSERFARALGFGSALSDAQGANRAS